MAYDLGMQVAVGRSERRAAPSAWRGGVIAAVGVSALALLIWWLSSMPAPTGPILQIPGDQLGAPVRVGVPFSYNMISLQNVGAQPAVLISATMGPHSPGLRLIGVGITRRYGVVSLNPNGFPRFLGPNEPGSNTLLPVAGTMIPGGPRYYPHKNLVELVVGLRVSKPGIYVLRGMIITYQVGRARYSERTGPILGVCAPQPNTRMCQPPGQISW